MKSFTNYLAISAIFSANSAFAGPNPGVKDCPSVELMADFDVSRYAGTWYEIIRDKSTPFELLRDCVVADYTLREDGTLGVVNAGYSLLNGWKESHGYAELATDDGSAGLYVQLGQMPELTDKSANYKILDTDYETYSIVYSCSDFADLFTFELLWVLSKNKELDQDTMNKVTQTIIEKVPSYDLLKNRYFTRQGGRCPYDERPSVLDQHLDI